MAPWYHLSSYHAFHTMHTLSSIAFRSFPLHNSPITCFCDDDPPFPEHLLDKDGRHLSLRTKLEIRYSPWAMSMMNGFGKIDGKTAKEFTGSPTGGGRGGDDDAGEGGGGGGDEGGDEQVYFLPLLTIAFAAFQLGYCIAVWMKDETLDFDFLRAGVGLFCLLAVAAIRLNNQTGVDGYIVGLGASIGVMLWTGEHCLVKKEGSAAGVVTLIAATMALMFTAALYKFI